MLADPLGFNNGQSAVFIAEQVVANKYSPRFLPNNLPSVGKVVFTNDIIFRPFTFPQFGIDELGPGIGFFHSYYSIYMVRTDISG